MLSLILKRLVGPFVVRLIYEFIIIIFNCSSSRDFPPIANSEHSVYDGRATPSNFHYVNQTADDENEPLISHEGIGDITSHRHDDFEYEPTDQHEDSDEESRIKHGTAATSSIGGNQQNYNTYYEINEIIEMGKMASLFFNRWGRTLFYLCITIYLYGDLAIYGAAVAKSLRDVACTFTPANTSRSAGNISDDAVCWKDSDITRIDAYRYVCLMLIHTYTYTQIDFGVLWVLWAF